MGERKVTILEPAVEEVARIALFIEGKGLPMTAKRFVDGAFVFLPPFRLNGLFTVLLSIGHVRIHFAKEPQIKIKS